MVERHRRRERPAVSVRAGQRRGARAVLPVSVAPLRLGADDPLESPSGTCAGSAVVEDPPPCGHGPRSTGTVEGELQGSVGADARATENPTARSSTAT